MRTLRKYIFSVLCLVMLLLAAVPIPRADAATVVYLLAVNDQMCDLPNGLLPLAVNGEIYVPYLTFDRLTTGVNLGIYCSLNQTNGTMLTLSSFFSSLTFHVNMGICKDENDNSMNFCAVMRNGVVYVPASAVCSYFELQYSFLPTTDRGTLIRISNSSAVLSDSQFLSSATLSMTYRYNNILKAQEPPPTPTPVPPTPTPSLTPTPLPSMTATPRPNRTPSPRPTPSPSPAATAASTPSPSPTATDPPPTVTPVDKGNVHVYLAVDASDAEPSLLTHLPQPVQTAASSSGVLLLFRTDSLTAQKDLIRQGVAAGHSIGLIASGSTASETRSDLEKGNEQLGHIARIRTHIVAVPGTWPEEWRESFTAEGWICWQSNLSGETASSILQPLSRQQTPVHITLPATPAVVSRVLMQLRTDKYSVHQPLETNLNSVP